MRQRIRPLHFIALTVIALASVFFHAVGGFPLQVAIGLALLSWLLIDTLQRL